LCGCGGPYPQAGGTVSSSPRGVFRDAPAVFLLGMTEVEGFGRHMDRVSTLCERLAEGLIPRLPQALPEPSPSGWALIPLLRGSLTALPSVAAWSHQYTLVLAYCQASSLLVHQESRRCSQCTSRIQHRNGAGWCGRRRDRVRFPCLQGTTVPC